MSTTTEPSIRKLWIMFALVISGEVIFLLPFVFPRIFRPTILDVFQITNLELGTAFSAYGVMAILAYVAGGPLADKYPARSLMSIALVTTGLFGLVLATIPSLKVLIILYGFWGITTILLFWSAMIRSTRVWGGQNKQGIAYGLLDGGRGLTSAVLASASVALLGVLLPTDISSASIVERADALKQVIIWFCAITFATALLVWIIIPPRRETKVRNNARRSGRHILQLAQKRNIWLQAIIVVCAYVGYKSTDDFSLFARDALGYDDVAAARIGTVTFWVRPFAAILAGYLADRLKASTVVIVGFVVMGTGCAMLSAGIIKPGLEWLLIMIIVYSGIGIYALRGIYFALVAESQIPVLVTGTAVGIISMVGFLPDVFFGPLMGYLLDQTPGPGGHEHVFGVVGAFAILGLFSAIWFRKTPKQNAQVNITT